MAVEQSVDEKELARLRRHYKVKYGSVNGGNLFKIRRTMKKRIAALKQLPSSPETDALMRSYVARIATPITDYLLAEAPRVDV